MFSEQEMREIIRVEFHYLMVVLRDAQNALPKPPVISEVYHKALDETLTAVDKTMNLCLAEIEGDADHLVKVKEAIERWKLKSNSSKTGNQSRIILPGEK